MQQKNIDYCKISGITGSRRKPPAFKHANLALTLFAMYFIVHILVWGLK